MFTYEKDFIEKSMKQFIQKCYLKLEIKQSEINTINKVLKEELVLNDKEKTLVISKVQIAESLLPYYWSLDKNSGELVNDCDSSRSGSSFPFVDRSKQSDENFEEFYLANDSICNLKNLVCGDRNPNRERQSVTVQIQVNSPGHLTNQRSFPQHVSESVQDRRDRFEQDQFYAEATSQLLQKLEDHFYHCSKNDALDFIFQLRTITVQHLRETAKKENIEIWKKEELEYFLYVRDYLWSTRMVIGPIYDMWCTQQVNTVKYMKQLVEQMHRDTDNSHELPTGLPTPISQKELPYLGDGKAIANALKSLGSWMRMAQSQKGLIYKSRELYPLFYELRHLLENLIKFQDQIHISPQTIEDSSNKEEESADDLQEQVLALRNNTSPRHAPGEN